MQVERIKLDGLANRLAQDGVNVLICSSSYESRCLSVPTRLDPAKLDFALVVENEHKRRYDSPNAEQLRRHFGDRCIPVVVDPASSLSIADGLREALAKVRRVEGQRYLVDVTTFTHESLLILVNLLGMSLRRGEKSTDDVVFAYVGAEDYSVGDKDEDKWLSKGVGPIRSVLGFAGELLPSRGHHLIVLVGFEHERARALIEKYEPSVISLGYGRTGTATNMRHESANRHFHRLVMAMAATHGQVREFSFACDDPVETRAVIGQVIAACPDYNTVIAPMNTKLSTLGAALVGIENPNVQICYARAHHYNYHRYSQPGQDCFLLRLPELFVHHG